MKQAFSLPWFGRGYPGRSAYAPLRRDKCPGLLCLEPFGLLMICVIRGFNESFKIAFSDLNDQ